MFVMIIAQTMSLSTFYRGRPPEQGEFVEFLEFVEFIEFIEFVEFTE